MMGWGGKVGVGSLGSPGGGGLDGANQGEERSGVRNGRAGGEHLPAHLGGDGQGEREKGPHVWMRSSSSSR